MMDESPRCLWSSADATGARAHSKHPATRWVEAVPSTANITVPAAGPHAGACGTMPGQMRLAVFSDVHGQVERLSACLHSIARVGADQLWCLGDAVDAFAVRQPKLIVACVNAIDDVCAVKLTGNHEAWALQDGSLPTAASAVLAAWTVASRREGVLAVHGSPQNPLMGYLSDERTVRAAIDRLPGWLCVHGHTHQALLWIREKDGTLQRQRRPSSQTLRRSARAIACPGAITGPQPKWLLVDTDRRRLTWHSLDAVAWTSRTRRGGSTLSAA